MTEPWLLRFTPIELAFLSRIAGTVAGRTSANKLLLGEEVSASVLASGFGGLRLRDWATESGDGFELDPAVRGIAEALSSASRWIQLGFLAGEQVSSVLLVNGPNVGILARPVETGVLDISALAERSSLEAIVREFVDHFVASPDAATMTVTVEYGIDGSSRSATAQNGRNRRAPLYN